MPYTPIIGTLGYVIDRANDAVLLVHRNKRAGDEHLGKWNGLGGKLEPGEDLAAGMRREFGSLIHLMAPRNTQPAVMISQFTLHFGNLVRQIQVRLEPKLLKAQATPSPLQNSVLQVHR